MFNFAIITGVYSYSIFFLGISGLLYETWVLWFTVGFWGSVLVWKRECIFRGFSKRGKILGVRERLVLIFAALIVLQGVVNFISALGPELAFDALWYHLMLPKLYLMNHAVYHIPGGLLYYSVMPKLGEMLYVGALSVGNEVSVKLLHFSFGIFTAAALYMLARKFFTPLISVITVVIFYSNLVVAWESTTAYIDLIRAFYEIMALWGFLNWYESRKRKWLVMSALMVGLAITTKLLAVGSLVIFTVLIIVSRGKYKVLRGRTIILDTFSFLFIALLVPLPWFIFSYVNTGNPVYPFFSDVYRVAPEPLSITGFFSEVWRVFMQAADPVSPIYMIFLPLIIVFFPRFSKEIKLITLYSLLAVIVWYFTPRTGGGRFLLPYLPAFSLLCGAVLTLIHKSIMKKTNYLFKFLMLLIIGTAVITIVYRFGASVKYLPVVFGQQSKHEFLSNNLNFSFGDFYDTDNYFQNNIKPDDTVLLYGFHNLYYVEFPFIHSTWIKPGDKFTYIAVQNVELPNRFEDWQLIYKNDKTMVQLYKPPEGGSCDKICVY